MAKILLVDDEPRIARVVRDMVAVSYTHLPTGQFATQAGSSQWLQAMER